MQWLRSQPGAWLSVLGVGVGFPPPQSHEASSAHPAGSGFLFSLASHPAGKGEEENFSSPAIIEENLQLGDIVILEPITGARMLCHVI